MRRILIVEDHTIVRQGIIRLLHEQPDGPFSFDEAATATAAFWQ